MTDLRSREMYMYYLCRDHLKLPVLLLNVGRFVVIGKFEIPKLWRGNLVHSFNLHEAIDLWPNHVFFNLDFCQPVFFSSTV